MGVAEIDASLADAVSSGALTGAAAAVWSSAGTYEGAAGLADVGRSVEPDTMFFLASMTKTVTAAALMQLIEQGAVALDDPAGEVVPELHDLQVVTGFGEDDMVLLRGPSRPITIRHLVTHTAGFAYDFVNETARRYQAVAPTQVAGRLAVYEQPLVFDPGESWAYGAGMDWVGRVVEAVSGQRLDVYFDEHLFGPLDMTDTTFVPNDQQLARLAVRQIRSADGLVASPITLPSADPEMLVTGGDGLVGTVGDYLRFTRMLLGRGQLDGERVLPPTTVDAMFADQLESLTSTGERRFASDVASALSSFVAEESGWGLSFQIHREGRPARRTPGSVSWMGGLNTFFWIDPATQLTGVFATQLEPFLDRDTVISFAKFERAVYHALG
jgi:methyl acetate hydrolase